MGQLESEEYKYYAVDNLAVYFADRLRKTSGKTTGISFFSVEAYANSSYTTITGPRVTAVLRNNGKFYICFAGWSSPVDYPTMEAAKKRAEESLQNGLGNFVGKWEEEIEAPPYKPRTW